MLLRVSFTKTGRPANPYFTQFTAERWRPITVEGTTGARVTPARESRRFGRLFVRRGSPADLRLPTLRPGRSLLLRAVVRDVVAGEPWIEILAITLDCDPLTPEERTRLREADRFLARANPSAAEKLYRVVLGGRTALAWNPVDAASDYEVSVRDEGGVLVRRETTAATTASLSLPRGENFVATVAAGEQTLRRSFRTGGPGPFLIYRLRAGEPIARIVALVGLLTTAVFGFLGRRRRDLEWAFNDVM